MARLFDRFDPDREKWSSYLMRAEFYFDSNNIMFNHVTRNICTSSEFIDQGSDRCFVRRSESGASTAIRGKTQFSRCASRFLPHLSAWPVPDGPWQHIHIDFAGPFLDDMWLVVMDAYSKWPHVLKLNKYPISETTSALDD